MNLGKQSKQSNNCRFESNASEDDFQKLMDICNSYGLNEQQTNQLIDEFKKGALFSAEQSFNDSLNQSQLQPEVEKHHEEEYSFKHHKQYIQEAHTFSKSNQSVQEPENQEKNNEESHRSSKDQPYFSFELLEKMLTEKFNIEQGLVKGLQDQNSRLRNEVQEKDKQINKLTQMKSQDTEIIMGLKDIISNLTISLKEKDASYKDIQEKYNNLMENRLRQLSSKRSLTEFSEVQLQQASNMYQNSMRDSSCNKKSMKNLKQSREQLKQNRQEYAFDKKRGNRIDVKKYKEMIQNLRNNGN